MAQKRSSISSSRPNLGDPYQIYTEVVNAGKNLQGSKRKVKWLFGFTESDQEYEVVLVHSLVSGKKTVFEDGKEIISSSNILASDFSHGWNSDICYRLFRVEAEIGLTSEHTYTFSIDGVKFVDMPRKPLGGSKGSKSTPKAEPFSSDARRSSAGGGDKPSSATNGGGRGNFQSPFAPSNNNRGGGGGGGGAPDPFASGGDGFDPFGEEEGGFKPNKSATSGSGSKPAKSTPTAGKATAATSLFASFDDNSANTDSFDPFGSSNNQNNTSSSGFGASDPFGAPQTTPPQKAPKKSTPTAAVAAPPTKRSSITAAPEPDLFGNFDSAVPAAAPSADPFAASASGATNNKPTRRSSAQEIQMDFAGLSFVPEPPKRAEPVIVAPAPEPEPAPVVDNTPKVVDPWDTTKNLVNLDLAGRNTKPVQRQSVSSGPTLDNLMGVQTAQRRTSMAGAPVDPFAIPAGGVPMGGGGGMHSFGGPAAPMAPQAPVYGRGLAGGPTPMAQQQQPFQSGMGGGMGMGGPMGGSMGGGYGGAPQNVRGSIGGGMTQYPYQQPGAGQHNKPPQSSLDSLSWN